jgi:hypothetical protein
MTLITTEDDRTMVETCMVKSNKVCDRRRLIAIYNICL